MPLVVLFSNLKQELVSQTMNRMTATAVTADWDWALGGIVTTQTRVVMWHLMHQTMVTKSSRPWDTFWCSDFQKPKGKAFDVKY